MRITRSLMSRAALGATMVAGLAAVTAATDTSRAASVFGGPWISIESPVNPYEPSTRGALLLVNTFHHGTPVDMPVVGKAEGLVNGERKSVALTLSKSSRTGTQAVRNQWGDKGTWTLLLSVMPAGNDSKGIQAVVDIESDGTVGRVTVPRAGNSTRLLTAAEVDRALRARAGVPTVVGGR